MRFGWVRNAAIIGLFGAQGLLFFFIPSLLPKVYLSPDETAVAVTARQFGATWSFRLPDKAVKGAAWAHPRSFVTQGNDLVPVGFLGLPLFAGIVWRLFGEIGLLCLTPFLVLSCVYPLWRTMRGLGRIAQIAAVATWLSYPLVILYSNRGLFPNLVVVCLVMWSAFLVWDKRSKLQLMFAGLFFGAALAVRPTEIIWAAAWVFSAWLSGKTRKQAFQDLKRVANFIGPALVVPAISAYLAWKTYGSPLLIGYWLRDPVTGDNAVMTAASTFTDPERIWPFGFHPRAVLSNAESYLVYILGPWVGVALFAFAAWFKRKTARPFTAAAIWTAFVLCLVYGNTVYQDHVGYNVVSVGNSYLRYLLPLAPFFAVSAGAFAAWCYDAMPRGRAKLAVSALVGCLVLAGVWTSFSKDDEGLNANVPELVRYESIRQKTAESYVDGAIIISERSDKVFFPLFQVASPMPDDKSLKALIESSRIPILLFDTTYDGKKEGNWLDRGFYLDPMFTSKNQTLYELSLISFPNMPGTKEGTTP